jgi:hypothetical protein
MRAFAIVFVLACGGGGSSKPPEKPPAATSMLDCGMVADHVAGLVSTDKPRPGVTPAAIKDLVSSRCDADKWSDDTKQCLHAAAKLADARGCAQKMTDEQRASIKTAAIALRKDAQPPAEPDDHSSDWVKHVVEEPGTKTR